MGVRFTVYRPRLSWRYFWRVFIDGQLVVSGMEGEDYAEALAVASQTAEAIRTALSEEAA